MAFDAARYVHRYYASLAPAPGNEYPRLRAWEYLWEYVWDPSRSWDDLTAPEQLDTTALHLGFYLANWGMFRGSSGLLQNSNLDLMKALARQLFSGAGPELFELSLVDFAGNGARLAHNRKLLETVLGSMDALSSRVSWTDTLKSKILLGVWGEFPALDRHYVAACRALYPRRGLTSVNGGTLTALHRLIGEERLSFPRLETARKGSSTPPGAWPTWLSSSTAWKTPEALRRRSGDL